MDLRFKLTAALSAICLSIAMHAAGKDDLAFRPAPAESYKSHQKQAGFIAAAAAYTTDEQTKAPFGKLNPYEHGVLPILLVVKNGGKQTLDLSRIQVKYISGDGGRHGTVRAEEVKFLRAPAKPRVGPGPIPGINRKAKNPLAANEIESRALAAKMLPPGDAAHGFLYFQAEHRSGAQLLVTGIREASTGNELFFMEIPVD